MIQVSFYKDIFDKTPQQTPITTICDEIKAGKYAALVNRIQAEPDKKEKLKLKQELPAFTVSGIFKNGHKSDDLLSHSGCVQIDIDNIDSVEETREKLIADKHTYVCFKSPSGTGLKVIFKIPPEKENHKNYFTSIVEYFKKTYKIDIDIKTKDIGRLCFVSSDEKLFYNEIPEIFSEINTDAGKKAKDSALGNNVLTDIENVIQQIQERKIDLTDSYQDWINIGFAFADQFGEQGRVFFHQISEQNPNYNNFDCNTQFDKCLKSGKSGISIRTFFKMAKQQGVDIRSPKIKKQVQSLPEQKHTGPPVTNPEIKVSPDQDHKKNDDLVYTIYHKIEDFLIKRYDFRYNVVLNRFENKEKDLDEYSELNESRIYIELKKNSYKVSKSDLIDILKCGFVPDYNPFIEYFSKLPKWDGTDHIDKLANHIELKDRTRFNNQFKKWLVRAVKTACIDAYFNKQAIVLVHDKQNSGKSTFCRFICPPALKDYIKDNIADNKDAKIDLTRNLIINLDELANLYKKELNSLKSLFSLDRINERLPYASKNSIIPRRCSFIGSVNQTEFLTDETGSVRWLVFEIDGINWNYKKAVDIDMVWSQAVHLAKEKNFNPELTPNEIRENEYVNKNYQVVTLEGDLIRKYLAHGDEINGKFMTSTDIMELLNSRSGNAYNNKINKINIGKELKFLGYPTKQQRINDIPIKGYIVKEN